MNDDLLSGVKDLKDAFSSLTPAFDEMSSSMKDANKDFKDLQSAVSKTSDVFGKLVIAAGSLMAVIKVWEKASKMNFRAYHRSNPEVGNYIKDLIAGRDPIFRAKGGLPAGAARILNHPWHKAIKDQLSPMMQAERWMRARDNKIAAVLGDGSVIRMPGRRGYASGMFGKQLFQANEWLHGNIARSKGRLMGAQFYMQDDWLHTKQLWGARWAGMKHNASTLRGFVSENKGALLLGALGAALTGAVAAATMFSKKMRELSTGMFTSGASMGQMKALSGLAGALGMSSSELGQRARSFGDLLTGGGIPAGLAAQIGINPYGGLGGDQNFFGKFQKALEYITDPNTSFNRASIMSRQFGMEDMMYLRFASPDLRRQALGATGMGSAEEMRKAADAQIQFNLTLKELTKTLMELGQLVLPTLTLAMKNFGLIVSTSLTGGLIGMLLGGPAGGLIGLGIGGAAGLGIAAVLNNNIKATENQTKATERNTIAMNQMFKDGVYGGGQRMRNAVPGAYGYTLMELHAQGMARSLGAFSIG